MPVGQGDLPSRLLAFDRAVRRQLESEEYALVHCFDPFSGYPVCEAKALHAYKVVYEAERFPSHELPALQPSIASDTRLLSKLRRHELFCLMNAEAVITGSEVTRHYLRSLGVPDSVIHTVRAPVDLAGYAKVSAPSEEARLLRLVHLRGRAAFDDVDTVLDALAQVKGKAAVELRVIGAPPAEGTSTWEARAWEKGVDAMVKLLPPVAHAELPLVLSDADLCLVPLADVDAQPRPGQRGREPLRVPRRGPAGARGGPPRGARAGLAKMRRCSTRPATPERSPSGSSRSPTTGRAGCGGRGRRSCSPPRSTARGSARPSSRCTES